MKHTKTSHIPYIKSIPEILKYQLITKLILAVMLVLTRFVGLSLLESTGRVAVSSGDFGFLFITWQGWVMVFMFLLIFFFYVAVDLNVKVIYSGNIVTGRPQSMRAVFTEGVLSIGRFCSISGLNVILYITLIAPIVGVGFSVGLTEGLKIPNFITAVIKASLIYNVLYTLVVLVFALIGVLYIFTLHGVLLDKMKVRSAQRQSLRIIKNNAVSYVWQNILIVLSVILPLMLLAAVLLYFPLTAVQSSVASPWVRRFLLIFIILFCGSVYSVISMLAAPFVVIKVTRMYYKYTNPDKILPQPPEKGRGLPKWLYIAVPAVCVLLASVCASGFDDLFPSEVTTEIIAHRGGGNEGPENTVAGLKTAIELGAAGSEIDIQRTKDGYYVVNHDNGFGRVAGVKANVNDLTLEQIRELTVLDSGEPIPTLEEMLTAARDKITLFVELKGATADTQMCDDAVKLVRDMGMADQVVFISLKYNLIDYLETSYPDMLTGYLTFLSYGSTAKLNCDYIGLEEESAAADAINSVHNQGKKVMVWTVNDKESQEHFLSTAADAIITDNIIQANETVISLKNRNDLERIASVIRQI